MRRDDNEYYKYHERFQMQLSIQLNSEQTKISDLQKKQCVLDAKKLFDSSLYKLDNVKMRLL